MVNLGRNRRREKLAGVLRELKEQGATREGVIELILNFSRRDASSGDKSRLEASKKTGRALYYAFYDVYGPQNFPSSAEQEMLAKFEYLKRDKRKRPNSPRASSSEMLNRMLENRNQFQEMVAAREPSWVALEAPGESEYTPRLSCLEETVLPPRGTGQIEKIVRKKLLVNQRIAQFQRHRNHWIYKTLLEKNITEESRVDIYLSVLRQANTIGASSFFENLKEHLEQKIKPHLVEELGVEVTEEDLGRELQRLRADAIGGLPDFMWSEIYFAATGESRPLAPDSRPTEELSEEDIQERAKEAKEQYELFCDALRLMGDSEEGAAMLEQAQSAPQEIRDRIALAMRDLIRLFAETDPVSQFQLLLAINQKCTLRPEGKLVGADDRLPVFMGVMQAAKAIQGYSAVLDYLDATLLEGVADLNVLEALRVQIEMADEFLATIEEQPLGEVS